MKIKHYIVTYKNNTILERAIDSIFATETVHDRTVSVIANHSADSYEGKHPVQFLRNETRPDFSTGHLSRNWNQAIINGFVDLKNPDADLLVLSQNDCLFCPGYLDACIAHHETYDLVSYGPGDNCVSYNTRAVARVGLWDERFCNIGYQEADYFLRAAIYLSERASINDKHHRREHNPINNLHAIIQKQATGFVRREEYHLQSMQYHRQSRGFFAAKWSLNDPQNWRADYALAEQKINNFIFYPYFENGVETLSEQMYVAFF